MRSLSRSLSNLPNAGAVAIALGPGRSSAWARPLGMTTIIGSAFLSAMRLSRMISGWPPRPIPAHRRRCRGGDRARDTFCPWNSRAACKRGIPLIAHGFGIVIDHLQFAVRDAVALFVKARRLSGRAFVVRAELMGPPNCRDGRRAHRPPRDSPVQFAPQRRASRASRLATMSSVAKSPTLRVNLISLPEILPV